MITEIVCVVDGDEYSYVVGERGIVKITEVHTGNNFHNVFLEDGMVITVFNVLRALWTPVK